MGWDNLVDKLETVNELLFESLNQNPPGEII
jgi:hypothetical protein